MALIFWILFISFLINTVVGDETWKQEDDRVKSLPGQPLVNFNHYAGYIKLRPDQEKALFYWFFEAEDAPSRKPLVLWLNGGPGCSSIAFGAAQEIGPFLVDQEEHLKYNKFSWNKVANIIFLDSPIGVGFSYTNNSKDLSELGDEVSASDNYHFLVGWFKRFSNFRSNEFYIVGESYGGHYAPQLADLIYERNKRGPYINLKGLMMGNAVINDITDLKGMFEYAWSHAIISTQVFDGIKRHCNFSEKRHTSDCELNINKFLKSFSDIDVFNIYSPVCLKDKGYKGPNSTRPIFAPQVLWNTLPSSGYDYCPDDYVRKYFNKKNVQRAIHANVTNLPYPFTVCSGIIEKWNDAPATMLPLIQKLLSVGSRIWIYRVKPMFNREQMEDAEV
ncbi:hypothetical protein PHAVU_011G028600 [Phaseolus vulgaris]